MNVFDAPPWEPMGQYLDGHMGVPESRMVGAAPTRSERYAGSDGGSGLTRRGVIYEYVRGHPGAHVRRMAKDLGIATGDLQYHLLWLEKHGYVKTKKTGFYRFVFPTMVFKEEQEVLLGVLSQDTPRDILLCLLREERMTQGGLAASLGYSQPTIYWHLERLVASGVVSRVQGSGAILYAVSADREDLVSFVKAYHPEVWKRWSGRLANIVIAAEVNRVDKGGSLKRSR